MTSIVRIQLRNFKRFENLTLDCKAENIFVGPNNCGKSSILDSLRILSGALKSAKSRGPRPMEMGSEGIVMGYRIPISAVPVTLKNITHNYSSGDAVLDFTHKSGCQLRIILNPDEEPTLYIRNRFTEVRTGSEYFKDFPLDLVIVPTLAPFDEEEEVRTRETVQRNRSTRLAARNFRNIWYKASQAEFDEFRALVEETWKNVSISEPEPPGENGFLTMFFSENRYDREIYWAGFGFQVWLQILTHILRGDSESALIIDEPDIYIHPELQRVLLKKLRERFKQFFLATHSTEIINDAEVGSIVSVNAAGKSATRISKEEQYQALFDYIGSADNVEISKLSRARKIIFFEGKDKKILQQLSEKAKCGHSLRDAGVLILAAGGFSQWRRVAETAWTFKNVLKVDANIYAIFDRDYRSDEEISQHEGSMKDAGIQCHVWRRKELENYVLSVPAILRTFQKRASKKELEIPDSDLLGMLNEMTAKLHDPTLAQTLFQAEEYARASKNSSHKTTVHTSTIKEFAQRWDIGLSERLKMVGGKELIGLLCRAAQDKYGISISQAALQDELRLSEIDPELVDTLKGLDARFY